MTDALIFQILAALAAAFPRVLELLAPDARASVTDLLARSRAALPAAGATAAATESAIAHHLAPPSIAREYARVIRGIAAPTSSALLSDRERMVLGDIARRLDFETADTLPAALFETKEGV